MGLARASPAAVHDRLLHATLTRWPPGTRNWVGWPLPAARWSSEGNEWCVRRQVSGAARLASGTADGRGPDPRTGPHGLTFGVELLQPDSHGDILLARGNPAEPPVIDPGYLTAESDLRGLVAGLRIAERLCDTAALRPYAGARMAPWLGKVDDAKLATFIREHAQTAYHPVGSCRMGSDEAAVVDCELRFAAWTGCG
jgi:choline dehydrogenase-like flavoprotein